MIWSIDRFLNGCGVVLDLAQMRDVGVENVF
jgi:hypothetical protein